MSRRSERREARRIEALVKGGFALLCLLAFLIGGIQNFVEALIGLIVGGAVLLAVGYLGYRYYQSSKRRAVSWFPTSISDPVSPVSAAPAASRIFVAPDIPQRATVAQTGWSGVSILNALEAVDWYQFEKFCAAVLRSEGYLVERKGGAQPDGGVDLIAQKDGRAMLVQCKQWRTWTVQENVIRELLGSMTHYKVSHGALYTLGGVTKPAEAFARQHGIDLVDGGSLAARAKARLSEGDLTQLLDSRERRCPKCEATMVWRTGNFTPFWGCSRFPRCRTIMKHAGPSGHLSGCSPMSKST